VLLKLKIYTQEARRSLKGHKLTSEKKVNAPALSCFSDNTGRSDILPGSAVVLWHSKLIS
jgi:hypothetical protein